MGRRKKKPAETKNYRHAEETPMRPEVGTQPNFKNKKPPAEYRYDSSLAPELDWDENPARVEAEALIARILETDDINEARRAAKQLKKLGRPFLNWTGKAERSAFSVPTLPLFIHERLSTQAIIETLKGHQRDKQTELELFADPRHSITDQILRAYEHRDRWVNRMILGDSLTVMNSLIHYEHLAGQVQMIYMDPPYGVKFGSNFQPYVRKRDVKHNDDEHMTREPEMVKAYRDTWELGLHSYLSYMRDRLLLARELLHPSGSVFVQISDENVHHVRELMDEVFGEENHISDIVFTKTITQTSTYLPTVADYILWYCRDNNNTKYRCLYKIKEAGKEGATRYNYIELHDGKRRKLTRDERINLHIIPEDAKLFTTSDLTSQEYRKDTTIDFLYKGKLYHPGKNRHWNQTIEGMIMLSKYNRIIVEGNLIRGIRYLDDSPAFPISNVWTDTMGIQSRTDPRIYTVQTAKNVIERCILMATDPGDIVLDPTCGSGTTAYAAEKWGRRWITMDVSRVPLALAKQRLLTATYDWFELEDEARGPGGGFVYKRKEETSNPKSVGPGIVPHITLKSIANDLPPDEEILVDRPERMRNITRVTGPFVFEATIPTPVDWEEGEKDETAREDHVGRMLEVLRLSPVLHLPENRKVTLKQVRAPARTLWLSAEALVENGTERPVALVFGPENGAVSERLVHEAAGEANVKHYAHLYVIGFAIEADAREYIENCEAVAGIPATYVQATPDILMGDLLKNMRSSQIFSVCGLPDVEVRRSEGEEKGLLQVELRGLDVFDPITLEVDHMAGDDVPAWFLDTDYNGNCFHVCQAFFPRTRAWGKIKKALKGQYETGVWDHLAGAVSAPFPPGETGKIAVKVLDERGNELLVVKDVGGVG